MLNTRKQIEHIELYVCLNSVGSVFAGALLGVAAYFGSGSIKYSFAVAAASIVVNFSQSCAAWQMLHNFPQRESHEEMRTRIRKSFSADAIDNHLITGAMLALFIYSSGASPLQTALLMGLNSVFQSCMGYRLYRKSMNSLSMPYNPTAQP